MEKVLLRSSKKQMTGIIPIKQAICWERLIRLDLFFRYALGLKAAEKRFCDRCMARTLHHVVEEDDLIYAYKRRRTYRCGTCGRTSL